MHVETDDGRDRYPLNPIDVADPATAVRVPKEGGSKESGRLNRRCRTFRPLKEAQRRGVIQLSPVHVLDVISALGGNPDPLVKGTMELGKGGRHSRRAIRHGTNVKAVHPGEGTSVDGQIQIALGEPKMGVIGDIVVGRGRDQYRRNRRPLEG